MNRRAFHRIPIYDLRLWVCVADDVLAERKKMAWAFGAPKGCEDCPGLCSFEGGRFALWFERKFVCHELIAHEVFHATHRMMEACSSTFYDHASEPFAFLTGYLTTLVYADLYRLGVKIHRKWPGKPTRSR